jgi:hypothetical protein
MTKKCDRLSAFLRNTSAIAAATVGEIEFIIGAALPRTLVGARRGGQATRAVPAGSRSADCRPDWIPMASICRASISLCSGAMHSWVSFFTLLTARLTSQAFHQFASCGRSGEQAPSMVVSASNQRS